MYSFQNILRKWHFDNDICFEKKIDVLCILHVSEKKTKKKKEKQKRQENVEDESKKVCCITL